MGCVEYCCVVGLVCVEVDVNFVVWIEYVVLVM